MSDPLRDRPAYRPNDPYETSGIQAGFQLPRWIWRVMFGCYALFFLIIAVATGRDTAALMMIVISVFYVVMVFGTTGILNAQKGPEYDSPLDRVGGVLETRTGPMNLRAVGVQILAVPIGMVFLGITVLVARATGGF